MRLSLLFLLHLFAIATTSALPPIQLQRSDWHSLSANKLLTSLDTSSSSGLTSSQHESLLQEHGKNALPPPPKPSVLKLIAEQFDDSLVKILLVVAGISSAFAISDLPKSSTSSAPLSAGVIFHALLEPIIILTILFLNAAVGVALSLSAQSSLSKLSEMQPDLCTVLREGKTLNNYPVADLVPGDIISLAVGDRAPADCRLIALSSSTFRADESMLTGESETVEKFPSDDMKPDTIIQDRVNMVFGGTMVVKGKGRCVVVGTGEKGEMGKIHSTLMKARADSDRQKTPLGIKLDEFGTVLTKIIGCVCLLVFATSVPKFGDEAFGSRMQGAIYYAKVAVALGVAAIPEGLPAVITLCLSLGTRRMAKRNTIVRKLKSVETLGCTTVICTDKTGTLTENSMTATKLGVFDKADRFVLREVGGLGGYDVRGKVENADKGVEKLLEDVRDVAVLCNDAKIVGKEGLDGKTFERVGDPTEASLCVLAEKIGTTLEGDSDSSGGQKADELAARAYKSVRGREKRLATLEFNRDRKSMSTLTRGSKGTRLNVKGAPANVIARCTKIRLGNGRTVPLTGRARRELMEEAGKMAAEPLRTIALAIRDDVPRALRKLEGREGEKLPGILKDEGKNFRNLESGMTFVGLVGIRDPPRQEVAEAISRCTTAGIRIIMITGDAMETATKIAKDCNIFLSEAEVKAFEGKHFFCKPEEEQRELVKNGNIVFCRTDPESKQKLVKMLQGLGEVPAMTGDGVNDAPALQQASIGIAMGISGTEVAKEAADMVLSDDNFATIVNAVEEGRTIYGSMQAFICFLISCNIGEILAILFASILNLPEPLTAMHLLWVNLVTDGPPATALGFNPPDKDVMRRKPRNSADPIMTRWLLTRYCVIGTYVGMATIGIAVEHFGKNGISFGELRRWSTLSPKVFTDGLKKTAHTLSLTTLVCIELLKALGAVSVDSSMLALPPWRNSWLIAGVTIPLMVHVFLVHADRWGLGGFSDAFGLSSLTKEQWLRVLWWSSPMIVLDEILKIIGRHLNKKEEQRNEV